MSLSFSYQPRDCVICTVYVRALHKLSNDRLQRLDVGLDGSSSLPQFQDLADLLLYK